MTAPKPKLLLVEDHEGFRSQLRSILESDYEVIESGDSETGLDQARKHRPQVVILDLGLPPSQDSSMVGFAILDELMALIPHVKVIIASGQTDRSHALQAIRLGAFDFLAKPIQMDELRIVLRRACHVAELERELAARRAADEAVSHDGIIGNSPKMQQAITTIRKVAPSNIPVLILGESGTGKEVAAAAIHQRSDRRDAPFVAINCAAIPESLLESELFGHEKGAFTGAHTQRKGRIETAEGGTLFLDEIGDLPLPLQVKLLRFLQERTIERIGGRVSIPVNVRVVAATNADLNRAMREGRFREDLYFRLAVVTLSLPPLRERQDDVILLAKSILRKASQEEGRGKDRLDFSVPAIRAMERHAWPGNVRELINRVKRAVIMVEGRNIRPADLDLAEGNVGGFRTLKEARESLERELMEESLRRNSGNVSRVATELGISRPTLYELMERFGMKP